MSEDAAFYDRALRRLDGIALTLAIAASLFFLVREGWRAGAGCAVCAAASVYNLRRLKSVAAGVGGEAGSSAGSAAGLGFRYLILAGACFGIIRYFEVSLTAIFAGLFISVAAVLVEILYELLTTRP